MLNSKQIAASATVLGFLAYDFFMPALPLYELDWGAVALSGVIIGQVNLIGTWGALGPGNIVVRLPWSILLGILTWYALAAGLQVFCEYVSPRDLAELGIAILGGLLLAQIPLWVAARFFRWRLINLGDMGSESSKGPLQFRVRHILLVMVLTALGLGPARLVLPPEVFQSLHMDGHMTLVLLTVVLTNLIVTVPCIWGALVKSNPVRPVLWPVYCGVVTCVELGVLTLMLGYPRADPAEALVTFFLMNILQCSTVYFTLRWFRAIGYRLVRPLTGSAMQEALNPPVAP